MKKLLALVLSCIFVLLLASCGEELPASDYVKKGKIMVDNTIPFVIDDSVAIDAKEAEAALIVGAHYSSFAAKFGYKVFHYADAPYYYSVKTYYTVYPLNDGRLLYVLVKEDDKGNYIIQKSSVIADKNTYVSNIFDWDMPYVLLNVPTDVRESEFQNGFEKSSLVYETYMKLEQKLDLPILIRSFTKDGWNMKVRMIKLENDHAYVFELTFFTEENMPMLTKTTYELSDGKYNKTETNEKTLELDAVIPFIRKLDENDYVDEAAYQSVEDIDTIDKGVFFKTYGGVRYEDEWLSCLNYFKYSYTTTDGILSECIETLDGFMKE